MNRMKRDDESCESGPPGFSRRAGGMEKRGDSARALTRSAFSGFSRTGQGQEEIQGVAADVYAFFRRAGNRQEDEQDGGQRMSQISESCESCHPVKGLNRDSSNK
jgi:hypothetical protein